MEIIENNVYKHSNLDCLVRVVKINKDSSIAVYKLLNDDLTTRLELFAGNEIEAVRIGSTKYLSEWK